MKILSVYRTELSQGVPRILFLLFLIVGCARQITPEISPAEAVFAQRAEVRVRRVVDGDTFEFNIYNDTMTVRVLGVDCYESRRGDRLTNQAARAKISVDSALAIGKCAKAFADSTLLGRDVVISRQTGQPNFDIYGRLVRTVTVNNKDFAGLLRSRGFVVP